MVYKKNNSFLKRVILEKERKKRTFLFHLLTFSIMGIFSFSLGCIKKMKDSSPYDRISFRIHPLERSGINERRAKYEDLKTEDKSSKLSLRSFETLNPLSGVVSLQQTTQGDSESEENGHGHLGSCNSEALNKAALIVQLPGSSKEALYLDHATHGYLENESQDCSFGLHINELFDKKISLPEDGSDRTIYKIESDQEIKSRKDIALWIEDSKSEEIQAKMYSAYWSDQFKNVTGHLKPQIRIKKGVDLILARKDQFKKWVYFINTVIDETSTGFGSSSYQHKYEEELAQKMFFLARVNENDEEEHITGSIRFQNRKHTFTISKSIAHVGTVVHHRKYDGSGESGSDDNTFKTHPLAKAMPNCTPNEAMTTKFYNSDGKEMTESDEGFSDFETKFGNYAVSDLVSLLPNETLKTSLNSIEEADTEIPGCGFKAKDTTEVFDYANFSFVSPPEGS